MLLVEVNAREKSGCWKQLEMFILYSCEGGAKNNTGLRLENEIRTRNGDRGWNVREGKSRNKRKEN